MLSSLWSSSNDARQFLLVNFIFPLTKMYFPLKKNGHATCRASCKAFSHPLLFDLRDGIMWEQGGKGDCFIEEETGTHPERRSHLPKATKHQWSISAQLHSPPVARLQPGPSLP